VLEDCTTEERRFVMSFLWAKGPIAKDVHKEKFLAYVGKCLSSKAAHKWVEKRGKCSMMKKTLKRKCGSG
jgi:hypothetical protein